MNHSKFSVLLPVYYGDSPDSFNKALQSICSNTIKPSQVVIIQDGPIPSTLSNLISKFSSVLPIDHYALESNSGLSYALNYGLSKIKYEYVFRADADDISLPHRFLTQVKLLENGYDLVGGQIQEFSNESLLKIRQVPLDYSSIRKFARFRNPFNHMTVAFKLSFIQNINGYPLIPFKEDYGLWIKALAHSNMIVNVNDVLVYASAGNSMYSRRKGLTSLTSELMIQRFLVKFGISSFFASCIILFCRVLFLSLPISLLKPFYLFFLRK